MDSTDVLTGFNTFDLLMTTPDSDWTSAALLLDLSAGSIYQASLGGDGPVPSDFFSIAPDLEFDTYVGVPGGNIAGGAGDIDRSKGSEAELSTSRLSVSFYNTALTDVGTFSIGRVTLSDDAIGAWSLISLTEDRQRVDLVGTVARGQIEIDTEASAAVSWAAYQTTYEYWLLYPPTYEREVIDYSYLLEPVVFSPELSDTETNDILPEPGTVALLGLGGLALLRRCR